MRRTLRLIAHALFVLIVLGAASWAAGAVWFHLQDRQMGVALWVILAVTCAIIVLHFQNPVLSGALLALAVGVILGWFMSMPPARDRDWNFDVAQSISASVSGDKVTLVNLRDFDWQSATLAQQNWRRTTVDLTQLETVDLFASDPHTTESAPQIVSFGFSDDQHIVFSVEVRRLADEPFDKFVSAFRKYDLILIGGSESDLIGVRAKYRQEKLSMVGLDLSSDQRRRMFLAFVDLAQQMEAHPARYNALSAMAANLVNDMAHLVNLDRPFDRRLILDEGLPETLADLGLMGDATPVKFLSAPRDITELALSAPAGAAFSDAIRP